MKRFVIAAVAVPMALLALLPPVDAQELGPPPPAGGDGGGFHGFAQFETHAQGQVVTPTAYLNAFREDNSLVGAVSEINGPPATSRNITALVFRGRAVTFVYGVIGGGGGERGTLPDPPPGEANAYYPTNPPEMTWTGPITGAGFPQVIDSRFHAKATDVPTGRTEGTVTSLHDPGYFTIGQATVVSHTKPADGGLVAEAVSVVHQLEVGPLLIQNIVSRAYAFVPTAGDPRGIATTVVSGAKVGDTPVQITDKGIVAADNVSPLQQDQVNKAMADAGFEQVRLLPSIAKPADDGASVTAAAGTLEFVKQDQQLGASNPQGVAGGGFSIGGAEAFVNTRRCSPDCGGGASSGIVDGNPGTGTLPATEAPSSTSSSELPQAPVPEERGDDANYDASSSPTFTTDTSGGGLGSPGGDGIGSSDGLNLSAGPVGDSGSTVAVTPPALGTEAAAGVGPPAAGVTVPQPAAVAAIEELGQKSAGWLRDLYLMGGLGLGIIVVAQRLTRAFA